MPSERQVHGGPGFAAAFRVCAAHPDNDEGWTRCSWGAAPSSRDGSGIIRHVAPGSERSRAFHFSGRQSYRINRFIQYAREARDSHAGRAGFLQLSHASIAGRPAGKNVIDEDDVARGNKLCGRRSYANSACQHLRPRARTKASEARGHLHSFKTIDEQAPVSGSRQFPAQEDRLVISARPQSPSVQRDGNYQTVWNRFRKARCDQPGQHRS